MNERISKGSLLTVCRQLPSMRSRSYGEEKAEEDAIEKCPVR